MKTRVSVSIYRFLRSAIAYGLIAVSNMPLSLHGAPADTLAVVPFRVLGNPEHPEIFSHGLPDAIASDLSNIPDITVIERVHLSAVLQEAQLAQAGLVEDSDVPELGRMIGAKALLLGTVQILGKECCVHVRLVDVRSGRSLFGVREQMTLVSFKDVFVMQDRLTENIIRRLGAKVDQAARDHMEKPPTLSEEAFDLYSRGLSFLDSGNPEKGIDFLKQAGVKDAGFARAVQIQGAAQKAFDELDREVERLR